MLERLHAWWTRQSQELCSNYSLETYPANSKPERLRDKNFDDELMVDEAFKQTVFEDLLKLAAENKFNSLEKPKQLLLLKDPFTIESDLLTPTMKLKRNVAKSQFQGNLDAMYSAAPMTAVKK